MRKRILIFLFATWPALAISQEKIPVFVKDSLDNYVTRALGTWQIPGVAVCVIKDGKVVVMKGYGLRDMSKIEKVDENTLFMIGSNTKAFTATALAWLDAEKKISLDDRVTKWIPYFKLDNKAAGEQAIIRDLLCHRIGFRTFQGDFTYWTSNLSRKEVIEKMSHVKAAHPFRTTWGYTNAAFLTAGEIIPAVTDTTWEVFLKTRIFDRLQMKNTLALSKDFPAAPNKCTAHTVVDGKLRTIPYGVIDNLAPAGTIGSSIEDLSHWVAMQLDTGKFNGTRVIPAGALEQTWRPHSIIGNSRPMFNTGHFALYGLGWFMEEYCGRKLIEHTGGVNGFLTSVTLAPEERLGIIVLTNTDQNAFFEALKWEIVDAYLEKPYRNYSETYLGFFKQQIEAEAKRDRAMRDTVSMHPKTELDLRDYTGTYQNDLYGTMKVVQEQGELRMRFSHHPDMYAKLEALGGSRFYASFTDPILGKAIFPFHTQNGKVTGVTVKVADFVEYNPYEFIKISAQ